MKKNHGFFISYKDGKENLFWNRKERYWTAFPEEATRFNNRLQTRAFAPSVEKLTSKNVKILRGWRDATAWNFEII